MITLAAFMADKFTPWFPILPHSYMYAGVYVCVASVNKNDHLAGSGQGRGIRKKNSDGGVIKNTVYISTQDVAFNADVSKNTIQRTRRYQSVGGGILVPYSFIIYYLYFH